MGFSDKEQRVMQGEGISLFGFGFYYRCDFAFSGGVPWYH